MPHSQRLSATSPQRHFLRRAAAAVAGMAVCVALLMSAGAAAAADAPSAMTFEKISGPTCPVSGCILATGEIGSQSTRDFLTFVREANIQPGALMLLDSAGGETVQAMKLGIAIRRAGLSTEVRSYDRHAQAVQRDGRCSAACAYAFLGGVHRTIGVGAKLGLQQFTVGVERSGQVAEVQRVVGLISTYVSAMGATSDLLIVILGSPSGHVSWLSARELSQYAVATST